MPKHLRRPEAHAPVTRDWLVAAIAAAGVALSAYLTWTKVAGATAAFCEAGSACDVVQASRYAYFLGVPTAVWGVVLYAVVVALALAGLTAQRWLAAFALSVVAVVFSAYLAALQVFVLRAVCPWCVADAVVSALLLGALLWRRPAPTGRRSPVRAARVARVAALAAAVTLVAGIGVHVMEPPGATPEYRAALARHLASTGAIFYGAYW